MIELQNITVKRGYQTLIMELSAKFHRGDLIYIKGKNGVGKTTLLRCIAGLMSIHSGQILFNAQNIKALSYLYSRNILFVGHALGLKEELTAFENIKLILKIRNQLEAIDQIKDVLNQLGITKVHKPVRELSAGQKRRVALSRIFLEKSPIWLLDEPFTALDKEVIQLLETRINEHTQNNGLIIMTSHQNLHADLKPITLALGEH